MGELGDLTNFLKESARPVQDLTWLDIDEDDYNELQRLPDWQKTIDCVPELQRLWDHKVTSNFHLEKKQAIKDKSFSKEVESFVKRKMMLGFQGKKLAEVLKSTLKPHVIQRNRKILEKVAEEHGLLGNVYIDPNAFESCNLGAKLLQKVSRELFVLKKKACFDCRFGTSGNCSKFGGKLVDSVEYTEEMFREYAKKLEGLGRVNKKVASDIYKNGDDFKEKIRSLFLHLGKPVRRETGVVDQAYHRREPIPIEKAGETMEKIEKMNKEAVKKVKRKEKVKALRELRSFLLNEVVKGKRGRALKESMIKKFGNGKIKELGDDLRKLIKDRPLLETCFVEAFRRQEKKSKKIRRGGIKVANKWGLKDLEDFKEKAKIALKKKVGIENLYKRLETFLGKPEVKRIINAAVEDLGTISANTIKDCRESKTFFPRVALIPEKKCETCICNNGLTCKSLGNQFLLNGYKVAADRISDCRGHIKLTKLNSKMILVAGKKCNGCIHNRKTKCGKLGVSFDNEQFNEYKIDISDEMDKAKEVQDYFENLKELDVEVGEKREVIKDEEISGLSEIVF